MSQLTWNAEGGTNGVTITPANSGGASGDAFDFSQLGVAATNQYSAQAANSNLSMLLATGASSVQAYNRWQAKIAGLWPSGMVANFGRTYVRIDAIPATDRTFVEMLDPTAATGRANIRVRSTGALRLRNAAAGTVATTATVLSLNTWYRVEHQVEGSAAGAWTLAVFLGNSAVPLETMSGVGANFGGVIGAYQYGHVTNTANSGNLWLDDIVVNDTGLPGPYTPPAAGVAQGHWLGVRAGNG